MRIWNYSIPSKRELGGGWASITIREDGFFAAVSDFGNYSYWWSHTGCDDVREFFLKALDWAYFAGKFKPERRVHPERSFQSMRQYIVTERRQGGLSKEQAREAISTIEIFEGDDDWEGYVREPDAYDLSPWEHAVSEYDSDVMSFTKLVMPQLAELIREDLKSAPIVRLEILTQKGLCIPVAKYKELKGHLPYGTVRGDLFYPDRNMWTRLPSKNIERLQEFLKAFDGAADVVLYRDDDTRRGYRLKDHVLTELPTKLSLLA